MILEYIIIILLISIVILIVIKKQEKPQIIFMKQEDKANTSEIQVKEFDNAVREFGTLVTKLGEESQEEKEEKNPNNNTKKTIQFFMKKIEEYVKIKRETLESDTVICNRIGISTNTLATYLNKSKYIEEIRKLRELCKQNSVRKTKDKDSRRISAKRR